MMLDCCLSFHIAKGSQEQNISAWKPSLAVQKDEYFAVWMPKQQSYIIQIHRNKPGPIM